MAARTRRQIIRPEAFWDTSALVPLCKAEALTPKVTALYEAYQVATWWATPVELASSLTRVHRMGQIDSAELARAEAIASELESKWWDVPPSLALKSRATVLLHQYDLRAADALQLAAALQWCENQPTGRIFLTSDNKLRDAARLTGFDTSQL
jgi:predicted nucleic acid-binding protein